MADYHLSPEALEDLDGIHAYIAENNIDAADRVLEAPFRTFGQLAHSPEIGRCRTFEEGLRSFQISGFRNYLIFYRHRQERVEIVRVLHGARHLEEFFSTDSSIR